MAAATGQVAPTTATTTGTDTQVDVAPQEPKVYEAPKVEELADE